MESEKLLSWTGDCCEVESSNSDGGSTRCSDVALSKVGDGDGVGEVPDCVENTDAVNFNRCGSCCSNISLCDVRDGKGRVFVASANYSVPKAESIGVEIS